MDILEQRERLEKWAKLIALTDAIERERRSGELITRRSGKRHRKYTCDQALKLQHLEQQRKELLVTMPLRVVQ